MRRFAAVEQLDVEGRLKALLRADPLAARIDRIGRATCVTARDAESHLYNRELARPCYVDVHPYMTDHHLGRALDPCGFVLSNMNAIHVGEASGETTPDARIRPVVTNEDWDAFARAEAVGWEREQTVPAGLSWGLPGHHAFIAWVDGQPAATAVLFVADSCAASTRSATWPSPLFADLSYWK